MKFRKLPTPSNSNRRVRDYVSAVERGRDSYYVVQNGKGWYVRKASVRTSNGKLFPTKSEALDIARARATKRNSKVLVFNNKGTLLPL